VTLRANALPLDPIIDTSYDPYAFMRDAYRQHRLYQVYYGNPPLSAIERLQGTSPEEENGEDLDRLLEQQKAYEKSHGLDQNGLPAPATQPAPPESAARPSSSGLPAPAG
jgi:phospholipid-binding lipoprotein MlaA